MFQVPRFRTHDTRVSGAAGNKGYQGYTAQQHDGAPVVMCSDKHAEIRFTLQFHTLDPSPLQQSSSVIYCAATKWNTPVVVMATTAAEDNIQQYVHLHIAHLSHSNSFRHMRSSYNAWVECLHVGNVS